VVMSAASLRVQVDSVHRGMIFGHIYNLDERSQTRRVYGRRIE
jgi:hypothetical protein